MKQFLKKHAFLLLCFFAAAMYLLICSKSSPLYPMNDWVDVNCFYTMGASLLEGLVPYRDLYEQKGPVLYFIYAVIALLTPDSFFGVWLLEILTYGLFLYYSGKIMELYLGDSILVWILTIILGGLIPITSAFAHGASVEEMCLFMSAYGLYVVLRAMKEGRVLTFKEAFTCGIWAAVLLWIKYTMLGLYLGLAIFIILWYLGWGHGFKALWQTIGAFFAGIGVISAVVFLYFLVTGALEDLYTVYFYNNIFLYPKEQDRSRLSVIIDCMISTLKLNKSYTYLFIPAVVWAIVRAVKDIRPLLLLGLSSSCLALGTYWGGWYIPYYGLVFAVFALFGLLAIGEVLRLCKADRLLAFVTRGSRAVAAVWVCALIMLMSIVCLNHGRNTYLMGYEKEDMPQYQFAEIINETEDATLLNFGFLDGGFYFAADVTPHARFFCLLNVQAPDMWQTMYRQVNEGLTDYVVTRDRELGSYNVDPSLYECVDQAELYFEGKVRIYYLYRLKALE